FGEHDVSQYPGLESNVDLKANLLPWGIYTPSISLQDWIPAGNQMGAVDLTGWVPGWRGKRSIVVADDAAFREKSKMLTAMERQKWLNSYMQKFLVVNSD
uniref:Tuberoinfundibular peptide of 39 residues n=1 Tax=Pseudonaja textilis TaxID=8673 RepID=A0A670ZI56_PSETE